MSLPSLVFMNEGSFYVYLFFTYQNALPENCGFPILAECISSGLPALPLLFSSMQNIPAPYKIRQLQMLNITVLLALCCTFTQDAI